MYSPQMNGIIFEKNIHNFLSKTRNQMLLNETEVRKIDNTITAIDHLLVVNDIYYCFQDKRLKTPISNADFNHFIKCVEKVSAKIENKVVAVYLSFTDFSSIANKQLEEENVKYYEGKTKIEFVKINKMDFKLIRNDLQYYFHCNNIFLYDDDGDCMMLYL